MWPASVSTAARRVSSDTPVHVVPSFDHFVTQWMSVVTVSDGSSRNSSHGQDTGSATAPLIVKLHSSRGVRGVGPADRTGKSLTTYWPGGTRSGSTCGRRPRKPREIGGMTVLLSDHSRFPAAPWIATGADDHAIRRWSGWGVAWRLIRSTRVRAVRTAAVRVATS